MHKRCFDRYRRYFPKKKRKKDKKGKNGGKERGKKKCPCIDDKSRWRYLSIWTIIWLSIILFCDQGFWKMIQSLGHGCAGWRHRHVMICAAPCGLANFKSHSRNVLIYRYQFSRPFMCFWVDVRLSVIFWASIWRKDCGKQNLHPNANLNQVEVTIRK